VQADGSDDNDDRANSRAWREKVSFRRIAASGMAVEEINDACVDESEISTLVNRSLNACSTVVTSAGDISG
jgi:hypothetical protein